MGESSVMSPALPEGESKRRADFIGGQIRVWSGHWGGWHIATHPWVEEIEVNEELTEARLDFKLVYEWGEAFFRRQEDGWQMTSSELTMIE